MRSNIERFQKNVRVVLAHGPLIGPTGEHNNTCLQYDFTFNERVDTQVTNGRQGALSRRLSKTDRGAVSRMSSNTVRGAVA